MESNHTEALELQLATLRAAIFAHNPVKVGDRVTWLDAQGNQQYGTVHALGQSADGAAMAGLRVAGSAWLWCEPVDNLAKVCGICIDCRTLTQRPMCMAGGGSTYWRRYHQPVVAS